MDGQQPDCSFLLGPLVTPPLPEQAPQPEQTIEDQSRAIALDEEVDRAILEVRPTIGRKRPLEIVVQTADEEKKTKSRKKSTTAPEKKKKNKKAPKKSRAPRAAAAAPKKPKKQIPREYDTEKYVDLREISPLPVVKFLQSRQCPKACGKCVECKKDVCGKCKACMLNAKPPSPGIEKKQGKRRCEALRCVRDGPTSPGDKSPRSTADNEIAAAERKKIEAKLRTVKKKLAELHKTRGEFDTDTARELMAEGDALNSSLAELAPKSAKHRNSFSPGFQDAYGVVSVLERERIKFANSVFKSSGESRTTTIRRMLRNDVDSLIHNFCTQYADILAPPAERKLYLEELEKERRSPVDGDDVEEPSESDSDSSSSSSSEGEDDDMEECE